MSSYPKHAAKVREVQRQIEGFYRSKQQAKVYHGATNSTRQFASSDLRYIDTSSLNEVVAVNAQEGYALAEPNVPLDVLVQAAMLQGMIPPVVAEFPGITVGGAVQGGSGESSSFKHGSFHDTCLEYEIVLGDGREMTASRDMQPDLFWGMSCAYGSLGIITLLKIKLIPATKYVKLSYHRTTSHQDAVAQVTNYSAADVEFVDGILFAKDKGVVMVGSYTDEANLPKARFSRFSDDWFYIHAKKIVDQHETYEEIIPLPDYLFRYDRGGFWVAKYGFGQLPFNRFTRLLFAGLFKTRTLFKLLHGSNYGYVFFAQDICLPERSVVNFLDYANQDFAIYPLWLCPLQPAVHDFLTPTALDTKLVINVGLWGEAKPAAASFTERNRSLEAKVKKLGGRKVLYAHAYYTATEFWKIYDKQSYDTLRAQYNATVVFPNLYDKIKVSKPTSTPSRRKGLVALFKSPYKH